MIRVKGLSFSYGSQDESVIRRASFEIEAGSFVVLCGPTGSGKSTLLKILNGLAPNFTGGAVSGRVQIESIDVLGAKPNELAHIVGYVNQQPESAFVADTVEEELAYGMEQLGLPRQQMLERVSWMANQLELSDLLDRPLTELSGGQQQRVAIGSAIAAGQSVLLLDEPTSALDDDAASKTLSLLKSLCESMALTVLIAEHRLERVLPHADAVIIVRSDGSTTKLKPGEALKSPRLEQRIVGRSSVTPGQVVIEADRVKLAGSRVIGLSGPNGSGKSTLLWEFLESAWQQAVSVAMVPQVASDLLFLDTVASELHEADRFSGKRANTTAAIFEELVGRVDPNRHPRDISAGQQLGLVLAAQLVKDVDLVLLDEPTRGLDAGGKSELVTLIDRLAQSGKAVLVASHDHAFLEACSDRTFQIENGEVVGGVIGE